MVAVDVEPAQGVLLVLDPFERGEPFNDWVAVEGPDAVAEKSIRVRVDHIISNGQEVDHSSVLIAGDCQIGNQHHLMLIKRPTVDLVSPRKNCLL